MEPQIFTLHNQILEAVLPEVAFPFVSDGKKHTIALVGGGGKTTLMYFLGDTYAKQNIPTLITTTTHIRMPEDGSYVTTMAAACRRWDAQRYAVVGVPDQAGKLKALPGTELHAYRKRAKQILVEADGAKMRPCKVPAEHEPVIPKECDIVIAVAGLDVFAAGRSPLFCRNRYYIASRKRILCRFFYRNGGRENLWENGNIMWC